MGILCHYDEIAVVPFLDFRIPLQRIRRTKANGMFPVLKNSKTIPVIEDSHIVCNHILTNFHYEEFLRILYHTYGIVQDELCICVYDLALGWISNSLASSVLLNRIAPCAAFSNPR